MANIFLAQPINYITIQEVRYSTSKPAIALLSDDDIKILIVKAEIVVNEYVGYSIVVADEPADVLLDRKMATLYCVEQIYTNGDVIAKQTQHVTSERTGDRAVSYSDVRMDIMKGLADSAKMILDNYRRNFYRQVI